MQGNFEPGNFEPGEQAAAGRGATTRRHVLSSPAIWVALLGGLAAVSLVAMIPLSLLAREFGNGIVAVSFSSSGPTSTILDWADNLAWFGLAALPVSMGVGILRYRLYEIDRINSRTLAYAAVTALLVGVYAGLVLLSTRVLSVNSPVAVAAFADRLKDAVDLGSVRIDLASVVQGRLEPAHVSVWLNDRG